MIGELIGQIIGELIGELIVCSPKNWETNWANNGEQLSRIANILQNYGNVMANIEKNILFWSLIGWYWMVLDGSRKRMVNVDGNVRLTRA